MNIKIIFYGIGRGLDLSIPAYQKLLIKPLESWFNVEVFHFLQREKYLKNLRSNEFGELKVPSKTFKGKEPEIYDFNEGNNKELISNVLSSKCLHNDDHASSLNLLKQLSLLSKAKEVLHNDDIVFACRDDLLLQSKLNIVFNLLKKIKKDEVIVPHLHWHNGINDRFIISNGKNMRNILSRIDLIDKVISIKGGINGEYLMHQAIIEHSLKVLSLPIKLSRVRINNKVVNESRIIPIHRPFEISRILLSFLNTLNAILRVY